MNNKLSLFKKAALDIVFFEDCGMLTWDNIVNNKVKYLTDEDDINPILDKLSLKNIKKLLLELENYFESIYQRGIIDANENNIEDEIKDFVQEYYAISNKNIEEQIEKESTIQALEQIFTYVDDNTYNRYLESKLKLDPHNNSDEDFDVVCDKYEYYTEDMLMEEIKSYKYNFKQIMTKYYQLGKKGV